MSAADRVLVLGGLGFIGASVTRQLAAQGRQVTALSRSLAVHADTVRALTAAGARVIEGNIGYSAAMAAVVAEPDFNGNPGRQAGAGRGR